MSQPITISDEAIKHAHDTHEGVPKRTAKREPVPLAMTFEELLGSDEESGETADDIIRAVRELRDAPSPRNLD